MPPNPVFRPPNNAVRGLGGATLTGPGIGRIGRTLAATLTGAILAGAIPTGLEANDRGAKRVCPGRDSGKIRTAKSTAIASGRFMKIVYHFFGSQDEYSDAV